MTIREALVDQLRDARKSGNETLAAKLERLLRDAHEAERLSLTGDGAPRSTAAERVEAA